MTHLYNYPVAKKETVFTTPGVTKYICCSGFAGQKNLQTIYLPNLDTIWMTYSFYSVPGLNVIYKMGGQSEEYANKYINAGNCASNNTQFPTYERYVCAPSLVGVSQTRTGVQVKWKQVEGTSKYRIFRKEEGQTAWKSLNDVSGSESKYEDRTAKSGKGYTYTVRCISSDGKNYTSSYDQKGIGIVTR